VLPVARLPLEHALVKVDADLGAVEAHEGRRLLDQVGRVDDDGRPGRAHAAPVLLGRDELVEGAQLLQPDLVRVKVVEARLVAVLAGAQAAVARQFAGTASHSSALI
jgi:hypothetical protein